MRTYIVTIDTDQDLLDEVFSWIETGLESKWADGELEEEFEGQLDTCPSINVKYL